MKNMFNTAARLTVMLITICVICGCAAFRMSVSDRKPGEGDRLSAKYDEQDLLSLADQMTTAIMSHPFPPAGVEKPILADFGIQNRTKSHMDTKSLSDTITTKFFDSGKIQLANTSRRDDLLKEQGFQLSNCTPETRAMIGKQLGAKYMMTGSMSEIERTSGRQVRVSEQQDVYYQLTMEITDLETGLITVRKQIDRLRRASKPIIGW